MCVIPITPFLYCHPFVTVNISVLKLIKPNCSKKERVGGGGREKREKKREREGEREKEREKREMIRHKLETKEGHEWGKRRGKLALVRL